MSSDDKELTPEEKLLALIQQDKRASSAPAPAPAPVAASTPASVPVVTPAPVPSAPVAPRVTAAAEDGGATTRRKTSPESNAAEDGGATTRGKASAESHATEDGGATLRGRASAEPNVVTAVPGGAAAPTTGGNVAPAAPSASEPKLKLAPPVPRAAAVTDSGTGAKREAAADGGAIPRRKTSPESNAAEDGGATLRGRASAEPNVVTAVPGGAAAPTTGGSGVPSVPPRKPIRMPGGVALGWPILNRGLALVVLVLLVVVVYSVASIRSGVERAVVSQADEAGTIPVQPSGVEAAKPPPVDEYLQKVAGRDIFHPMDAAGGSTNAAGPKVSEFKLIGVSVDAGNPAGTMAILRSKTASQTFFVKVGDALGDTGFVLDRVLKDRAIIKKQRQEIEVR